MKYIGYLIEFSRKRQQVAIQYMGLFVWHLYLLLTSKEYFKMSKILFMSTFPCRCLGNKNFWPFISLPNMRDTGDLTFDWGRE